MHKDDILRLLRSSNTGYISGAELARGLKVSRTAVWKHIKSLEMEGYGIEAVPSKGYRLMTIPDIIQRSELEQGLDTAVIGRAIHQYAAAPSTNTLAMDAARDGAPEGAVFVAETQTGGRGRLGRTWISPKGNLYVSVILRPPIPPHKAPLLTLMAAVAVASGVRKHLGLPAGIKWPNDIFLSGKKAGGLLTEMSAEPDRVRFVVIGIGLNVNMDLRVLPPGIRDLSTTLAAELGEPVNRAPLLREIFRELDRWYRLFLRHEAEVLAAWEQLNVTVGRRVAVSGAGEELEGVAQAVDAEGRLILRLDDGTIRQVAAGDVTIVKKEAPDAATR